MGIELEQIAAALGVAIDRSAVVDQIAAELGALRRMTRNAGRPFNLSDRGVTDGTGNLAAGMAVKDRPPIGQLWRLEAMTISVAGASAAAIIGVYLDAVAEDNLVGFLGSLVGAGPARGIITWAKPVPWYQGVPLLVTVAGAAAAADAVAVRYWGTAEEIGQPAQRSAALEGQGAI